MVADAARRRRHLLRHVRRRRRPQPDRHDDRRGRPDDRLGADHRGGRPVRRSARARLGSVAGRAAARARRADGAVGRLVGAARRQLQDAGRMLAYAAFFGAAVALARTIPARWPAVLGGIVARGGRRLRVRAADEGLPGALRHRRRVREAARSIQLLERDRADRGDGRDRLHVARRAPLRARAAERARLSGDRPDARHADARLLAWRADLARARPRPLVLHRAAAASRGRGAAERRRRRRDRDRLGLLDAGARRRKRRARGAHARRAPARRAAARDGRAAERRRPRVRLLHRPSGAVDHQRAGAPARCCSACSPS